MVIENFDNLVCFFFLRFVIIDDWVLSLVWFVCVCIGVELVIEEFMENKVIVMGFILVFVVLLVLRKILFKKVIYIVGENVFEDFSFFDLELILRDMYDVEYEVVFEV